MSALHPQPPPGGNINIGWQLEVGTTVTFLCACIAVTARTFARYRYSRIAWDDGLMVFALVCATLEHGWISMNLIQDPDTRPDRNNLRLDRSEQWLGKACVLPFSARGRQQPILDSTFTSILHQRFDMRQDFHLHLVPASLAWLSKSSHEMVNTDLRFLGFCSQHCRYSVSLSGLPPDRKILESIAQRRLLATGHPNITCLASRESVQSHPRQSNIRLT